MKNRLSSLVTFSLAVLAAWALFCQDAFAQAAPGATPPSKSYVPVYVLVVIVVGIGVWLVCYPSHRSEEIRGELFVTPTGIKGEDFHKPH